MHVRMCSQLKNTRQIARAVDELPLDDEILRSLHSLGWDDREALQRALLSSEPVIEKAFYRLLHRRKRRRVKKQLGNAEPHVQKMDIESYESMGPMAIPSSRRTAPMPIRSNPRAIPPPAHARSSGYSSVGSYTDQTAVSSSPVLGSTPKKTWFASFFGSYKERQSPSASAIPSTSFGTPGSIGAGGFGVGSFSGGGPPPGAFSPEAQSGQLSFSPSPPAPYTARSNRPVTEVAHLLRQALKDQQVVFSTANNIFHAKYDALDGMIDLS